MVKNTSFKIPNSFIIKLDLLVRSGVFNSRGEAIRIAIEDYINENYKSMLEQENKEEKFIDERKKSILDSYFQ